MRVWFVMVEFVSWIAWATMQLDEAAALHLIQGIVHCTCGHCLIHREKKTLERTKFDRDTLNQEKHDNVTDPTSTGRPVCGHESTERCVLTPKHVENDQTGTGRPVCGHESTETLRVDT